MMKINTAALYILLWSWCGFQLFKQFFRESSLEMSALLVFGGIVFISTFTESTAWASFNTPLNLLYLGALATLSPVRKTFVGQVPVYVSSGAARA